MALRLQSGDRVLLQTGDELLQQDAGGSPPITATLTVTLGDITLDGVGSVAIGGTLTATLDPLQSSSDVNVDIGAVASVTLGDVALSGQGDVDITAISTITFEDLGLSSAGEVSVGADSGITLDALTLSSDVSVIDGISASSDITFDALTLDSAGDVDIAADVAVTLDALTSAGGATVQGTKVVSCFLSSPEGDRRANLTGLSWAWFDNPDPYDFSAPTDSGESETTDASGLLSITLSGTGLATGQTGLLVVRTDDGAWYAAYNLDIDGGPVEVILGPADHTNGGCILGNPLDITSPTVSEECVFDNPVHPNGCIFDDPSQFSIVARGSGAKIRDFGQEEQKRREDEEILAIIMAAMT